MPYVLADRVFETTTTTGTGDLTLLGSPTGFETFVQGAGDGSQVPYLMSNDDDWEIGLGTITEGSPDTLSRDTVYQSTNSDALVNFGSGTKNVRLTLPSALYATQQDIADFITEIPNNGVTENKISSQAVSFVKLKSDNFISSLSEVLTTATNKIARISDLFDYAEPKVDRFVSGEQSVGVGTTTIAHGLSSAPTKIYLTAVCKIAEGGYSVGEKLQIGSLVTADKDSNNLGVVVSYDDTNLYLIQSTNSFFTISRAGGSNNPTDANWRIIVTAEV